MRWKRNPFKNERQPIEFFIKALLEASNKDYKIIPEELLKAVDEFIPSKILTFWKVNHQAETISTLERLKYSPSNKKIHEYVLPLKKCLLGDLFYEFEYREIKFKDIEDVRQEPFISRHRAKDRIREYKLKRFVVIPIPYIRLEDEKDRQIRIDSILSFYPEENNIEIKESDIDLISNQFASILAKQRLLKREILLKRIMNIYKTKRSKELSTIMGRVFDVLNEIVPCQGASLFSWSPLKNKLVLNSTTGIEGNPNISEVTFYLGENITGIVANNKESKIIGNLNKVEYFNKKKEWIEKTKFPPKSLMAIPILSPSRRDDLLGIIRFLNRLNHKEKVVDSFSYEDQDLIEFVCSNILSLYMEFEQNEAVRIAFSKKLTHEIDGPTVGIRGSASNLMDILNVTPILKSKAIDHVNSIIDQTDLQLALVKSSELLWKRLELIPKSEKYAVTEVDMEKDVIRTCKKLVIPICRKENLFFDNINITGKFPTIWADKHTFQQVFLNLLTNAIKYRDYDNPDNFRINIIGEPLSEYKIQVAKRIETRVGLNDNKVFEEKEEMVKKKGFLIKFEDFGKGIGEENVKNIFIYGFRDTTIMEKNVKGLGIGLSLAKTILEDFYGNIYLDNLRKPTRFIIFINEIIAHEDYTLREDWVNIQHSSILGENHVTLDR